jgi:capsule polysaccharide export protein KpsE/RkpR
MPREEQRVLIDNMNETGVRDIVFGAQEPIKAGGKRHKKTRKETKRKVRKNRKITRRRQ